MKPYDVAFPIKLVFENGEIETYVGVDDLVCNLEDFDSEREPSCKLTDARGRPVRLKISTTFLEVLELRDPQDENERP